MLETADAALQQRAPPATTTAATGRRAQAQQPKLTLLAWSAEAQSATNRPGNLLIRGKQTEPWISTRVDQPVALDFQVADGLIFDALKLDASGVDSRLIPEAAEVFLSYTDSFQRARSVWGGTLTFDKNDQAVLRFAPTKAGAIRVVLYPKRDQVSLRRIAIQSQ